MNGKTMLVIAGLCSIAVSGCTSLQSVSLSSLPKGDNAPSGLTYRLPAKQFSVKATYEITACTVGNNGKAKLDAKVSASFTESLIGVEAYTINYQKLNALTKMANTEFQLSETGLLTGVNVSIADQTGAVISNAATAAAGIARAVALPGISLLKQSGATTQRTPSDRESPDQGPCDQINNAVTAKDMAERQLNSEKGKDADRAATELQIREADVQIKALKDLAETYEQLGEEGDKRRLLKRVQLQEKIQAEAEATLKALGESQTEKKAKKLAEAKGELVVVGSKDFVPGIKPGAPANNGEQTIQEGLSVDVRVTADDLSKVVGGGLAPEDINLPVVRMTLEIAEGLSIDKKQGAISPDPSKIGIAYRTPVAAIARVFYCKKESLCTPKPDNLLLEKSTQIPQLGPIGSINLDNVIFDDNLIELAFNGATGAPSKLTFRAKSKAEAASASVKDAAGTYLQLQKDKRDDRIAANKALLDQATAQVTLDKAKSDLALSKVQANAAAATTEAELQQALVSAQVQLLRDQHRLDAVRTGTATAADVELEMLKTQGALLAERIKIMKLEQEISEQKARNLSATVP